MRPAVVLIGPPGAGKTTVGRILAKRLGLAQRDTDDVVEEMAGKPISDIFIDDGEAAFRQMEHDAVVDGLTNFDGVLALGGGAVMTPAIAERLREEAAAGTVVVFLDVSWRHAAPRVGLNVTRPLLLESPRKKWLELMAKRRTTYEDLATFTFLTDGKHPQQIARQLHRQLKED
jgi:shikimate kinase